MDISGTFTSPIVGGVWGGPYKSTLKVIHPEEISNIEIPINLWLPSQHVADKIPEDVILRKCDLFYRADEQPEIVWTHPYYKQIGYDPDIIFQEVKGEDIRSCYNIRSHHYLFDGSSMSGDQFLPYLDLYTQNDNVSLLVGILDTKVVLRTLVWDATDGKRYYDGVYGAFQTMIGPKLVDTFHAYTQYNHIYEIPNLIPKEVHLEYPIHVSYPYVDNFSYLYKSATDYQWYATTLPPKYNTDICDDLSFHMLSHEGEITRCTTT